eukprot:288434-Chlamydomonas_euryale.AAC.1
MPSTGALHALNRRAACPQQARCTPSIAIESFLKKAPTKNVQGRAPSRVCVVGAPRPASPPHTRLRRAAHARARAHAPLPNAPVAAAGGLVGGRVGARRCTAGSARCGGRAGRPAVRMTETTSCQRSQLPVQPVASASALLLPVPVH